MKFITFFTFLTYLFSFNVFTQSSDIVQSEGITSRLHQSSTGNNCTIMEIFTEYNNSPLPPILNLKIICCILWQTEYLF